MYQSYVDKCVRPVLVGANSSLLSWLVPLTLPSRYALKPKKKKYFGVITITVYKFIIKLDIYLPNILNGALHVEGNSTLPEK